MILFLSSLAIFFTGLSSDFDFSMSKDFSISKELPHVNFVECVMQTKYTNNSKKSSCHDNSPKGLAQVRDNDTFLIY